MLSLASTGIALLAHPGQPVRPHDAWTAWSLDPLVVVPLTVAVTLHVRGGRQTDSRRRASAFAAGVAAVVLALLSPIDAVAEVLLSAHMVQHVLLVAVAAPLLAYAAPGPRLLRGMPGGLRTNVVSLRQRAGLDIDALRRLRHPLWRWGAYVAGLWLWHASKLYGLAVDQPVVHALEHLTFLGTGLAVWTAIVGDRRTRTDRGAGVMLIFLLILQGVVLSALLTFSTAPWYDRYAAAAPGWSLDPLTDQHLAGLIMWFPTGLIYTVIAVALVATWLNEQAEPNDRTAQPSQPPTPATETG